MKTFLIMFLGQWTYDYSFFGNIDKMVNSPTYYFSLVYKFFESLDKFPGTGEDNLYHCIFLEFSTSHK